MSHGGYIEGSDVKENDTVTYMLIFMERADAEIIAKALKKELNLASIMIEETTSSFSFIAKADILQKIMRPRCKASLPGA